jgi:hypothetical protein
MASYADMSSGYADKINQMALRCGFPKGSVSDGCCSKTPPGPLTVQLPSMLLLSKKCPPPTAAQFALYPKVAVPCSVRTEALATPNATCASLPLPTSRFAKYNRYQPAVPCQPLPQSSNTAGISLPSIRGCNIKPTGS